MRIPTIRGHRIMESSHVATGSSSAAYPLARKAAKAVGVSLALLSGVYAVLSYYSSIAALRAAVEANKLTLLLYCQSNNSTDDACEQVRNDISPGQAVAEVFGDEPDGSDKTRALQTRSLTASTAVPSPASNGPAGGDTAPWSSARTVVGSVRPTTLVTSVRLVLPDESVTSWPSKSGVLAASPTTTARASIPIEQSQPFDDDRGHRSWSGLDEPGDDHSSWHIKCEVSWHTKCETLHQQAERAQQQMDIFPCPLSMKYPGSYRAAVDPRPTSELSATCNVLRGRYMEARQALELWNCPPARTASVTTGRLLEITNRPQALAIDSGGLFGVGWQDPGKFNWCRTGALLIGVCMGYLVCLLHYTRRKRKMRKEREGEVNKLGTGGIKPWNSTRSLSVD